MWHPDKECYLSSHGFGSPSIRLSSWTEGGMTAYFSQGFLRSAGHSHCSFYFTPSFKDDVSHKTMALININASPYEVPWSTWVLARLASTVMILGIYFRVTLFGSTSDTRRSTQGARKITVQTNWRETSWGPKKPSSANATRIPVNSSTSQYPVVAGKFRRRGVILKRGSGASQASQSSSVASDSPL